MALATTRKRSLSVDEYLAKIQSLVNDMATAGKPLDDKDPMQYILSSLDELYDSMVNSVSALAAQMISFKACVDQCSKESYGSYANFAKRG
jgi:hypothetical protein